ncbi:MAG: sulfatase [Bradymonadaceae bacterium]|nr:sulfatase [Lujinxingiaceae bacterium]
MFKNSVLTVSVLLVLVGCDKSATTHSAAPLELNQARAAHSSPGVAEEQPEDVPEEVPEVRVALADFPSVDLIDNRHRWHLFQDGLVIPFASEGLRKYAQEYSRPFGPVVEVDGRRGRTLSRASALLRVPWTDDQPTTARFFMHGGSPGQRVQLNVNGKRAGVVEAPQAWSAVDIAIPAGFLRNGENELRVSMRSQGTLGGQKTYGLFHAIELGATGSVADRAAGEQPWPALHPVAGGAREALGLGGFKRLTMHVEIPTDAWLEFGATASADAVWKVLVRGIDGQTTELGADHLPGGESRQYQLDLAAFADQLVALELHGAGVVWTKPRIGLAQTTTKEAPAPYDNVILLVVDTLRSDRMALYTDTRVQTPRFTEAGRSAAVFLNNQAASPSSPPSHASIQTGMIPRVHGVDGDRGQLRANTPLLSSQLGAAGIATAYVGNNSFGMSRLRAAGNWSAFHQPVQDGLGIDCRALVGQVMRFVRAQKEANQRFFVSALPFEPHVPYRFHEGITEKYHQGTWGPPVGKFADGYLLVDIMAGRKPMNAGQWSQLEALYDGEVEHMDRCFGELLDQLEALGLRETTAIVLTSDHGEGLNERGRLGHVYGHYTELSNVPLVVYAHGLLGDAPGPRRVTTPTSCIDVTPTVLDLMGVPASDKVQGESVLAMALRDGPWSPNVVSTEYGRSYSLRSLGWRLIVNYDGSEELYDVNADPKELDNLIAADTLAVRYLRELAGFYLEHRSDWKKASWGSLANHHKGFIEATARGLDAD